MGNFSTFKIRLPIHAGHAGQHSEVLIEMDGRDITRCVRAIRIDAAVGRATRVLLDVYADTVEIVTQAEVGLRISGEGR